MKKNRSLIQSKLLTILFIFSFLNLFPNNLFAQSNNYFALQGSMIRSNDFIPGSKLSFNGEIKKNLFLSLSVGAYFNNDISKTKLSKNNFLVNKFVIHEKMIIPLEFGSKLFFGDQDFKPYLNFDLGFNYYEFYEFYPNKEDEKIINEKFFTDFAPSLGFGIGVTYPLTEYFKFDFNFSSVNTNKINRYVRFGAGLAYSI